MVVKRRCVHALSSDNFEDFSPMEVLEGVGDFCGDSSGFSVCVLAGSPGVLMCLFLLCRRVFWVRTEFVEPQSFSLSGKRQAFLIDSQGGMSMASSLEEVPPITRRKIQNANCGRPRVGCGFPNFCKS